MAESISQMTPIDSASATDLHMVSKLISPEVYETFSESNDQIKDYLTTFFLPLSGGEIDGDLDITGTLQTDFIIPLESGYVSITNLQLDSTPHFSFAAPNELLATDGTTDVVSIPYGTENNGGTMVQRDMSGNFSAGTITAEVDFISDGGLTTAENILTSAAVSGGELRHEVMNTSNTAGSHAVYRVTTGGASAGDPYFIFTVSGVTDLAFGVDNSDGDSFKFDFSDTLGGSTSLALYPNKDIVPGIGALATNATAGFMFIESCAGTPTGTPTTYTGRVPIVFDTSGSKVWFYFGGSWKGVAVA